MRLLELSLRNYRVFEEVDLELPSRVIGVVGQNGSGKSTLMESVAVALYGVDAARTKKNVIRTHGTLADCEIRLVFEHAGSEYEIRRALRGRGSAPEAELLGSGLLLASGVSEVDAEVARLLHMDLPVFRASVYAEQKQLDAFSEVTTGKRKEMALRLLGIRPVDEARRAARGDARATKQSAEQLSGAIADTAQLEAELKEAKDLASEAATVAKEARRVLSEAERRARAAASAFVRSEEKRRKVENLTVQIGSAADEHERLLPERDERVARTERLVEDLAALPALEQELRSLVGVEERHAAAVRVAESSRMLLQLEKQLAATSAIDAARSEARVEASRKADAESRERAVRARAERDRAAEAVLLAQQRLDRASEANPEEPCPTCGQPLGKGFAAYVRHCKAEVAATERHVAASDRAARAAEAARKKAATALAEVERTAAETRAAGEQRARVEQRLSEVRSEIRTWAAPFKGEPPDPAVLKRGVERARKLSGRLAELAVERKRLDETERDLARISTMLERLDAKLETLRGKVTALGFDPVAHQRARTEQQESDAGLEAARVAERLASDALGRVEKDVRELSGRLAEARETEKRVGDLRSEARYLERTAMLLDGFRDHLVARVGPELSREAEALFRELTNHEYDDLRIDEESLEIQIADGDSYFPVERFSGSETDLANLALRVAISAHLSRMSGADLGLLVLDEVLGSLDAERKDSMVRALGGLSGRFHQLFVITHSERVKDQFPASIEVRKIGRRRSEAQLV